MPNFFFCVLFWRGQCLTPWWLFWSWFPLNSLNWLCAFAAGRSFTSSATLQIPISQLPTLQRLFCHGSSDLSVLLLLWSHLAGEVLMLLWRRPRLYKRVLKRFPFLFVKLAQLLILRRYWVNCLCLCCRRHLEFGSLVSFASDSPVHVWSWFGRRFALYEAFAEDLRFHLCWALSLISEFRRLLALFVLWLMVIRLTPHFCFYCDDGGYRLGLLVMPIVSARWHHLPRKQLPNLDSVKNLADIRAISLCVITNNTPSPLER